MGGAGRGRADVFGAVEGGEGEVGAGEEEVLGTGLGWGLVFGTAKKGFLRGGEVLPLRRAAIHESVQRGYVLLLKEKRRARLTLVYR